MTSPSLLNPPIFQKMISNSPQTNSNSSSSKKQKLNTGKRKKGDDDPSTSINRDPAIQLSRQKLPIWSGKDAIVDAVKNNDTVVILGETGSGKTTRECTTKRESGRSQR